jgi:osmoprotectant transport system ATP-binding protein
MMSGIINFKEVTKHYDEQQLIEKLTLEVAENEIFVLVGPSGSGKTTLLKMINGLIEPTNGVIEFEGQDIAKSDLQQLRWKIGYVLQQIALFPTMTVQQNIAVIPEMLGWDKKKIVTETNQLLTLVGLDPTQYKNRYPRELSGGEQQRIGILRAIIAKPDVILMDEPFSALDPLSRSSLQDLVVTLHEQLQTTILFVTHDMKEALKVGTRIGVMHNGILEQVGTPAELVQQPKTEFVRSFFGETTVKATLNDLLAKKFYSREITNEAAPKVLARELVEVTYGLFAKHETILVIDEAHVVLGEVSHKDIFSYLESR